MRFSGDEVPYSSKGRFRIRVADEDLLMSPAEVRVMALDAEAQSNPWDARPSERPMSDVEEPVLIDYVTRGNECGRISFNYDGVEDTLERLGFLPLRRRGHRGAWRHDQEDVRVNSAYFASGGTEGSSGQG